MSESYDEMSAIDRAEFWADYSAGRVMLDVHSELKRVAREIGRRAYIQGLHDGQRIEAGLDPELLEEEGEVSDE